MDISRSRWVAPVASTAPEQGLSCSLGWWSISTVAPLAKLMSEQYAGFTEALFSAEFWSRSDGGPVVGIALLCEVVFIVIGGTAVRLVGSSLSPTEWLVVKLFLSLFGNVVDEMLWLIAGLLWTAS
ncbi:predicted protein [Arabidopsis lyrata subsp. lyrata]|uniref:Predicted protein n=1 Tax=Arabidopsis lyrata subsp. lyrata TaxID=81972 RepID=D7L3R8_ARALL|nr:predicted protein [Arabidopsis lyrata subsp. lyrata]